MRLTYFFSGEVFTGLWNEDGGFDINVVEGKNGGVVPIADLRQYCRVKVKLTLTPVYRLH
jgi:hypothetical protein